MGLPCLLPSPGFSVPWGEPGGGSPSPHPPWALLSCPSLPLFTRAPGGECHLSRWAEPLLCVSTEAEGGVVATSVIWTRPVSDIRPWRLASRMHPEHLPSSGRWE